MSPEVKREFERMLAARQRLLDLRSSRIEQLLRLRLVLRGLLADFFETLDPIANVRLAEVSAEGSKAHGDLTIALSFFEGSRMRIGVDTSGRFNYFMSIPSAFDDVARMLEIEFSSDMTRVEAIYEPFGEPAGRRRLDLVATALALLAHAVATVEEEAGQAPGSEHFATTAAPVVAAHLSVSGLVGVPAPPDSRALEPTVAVVTPPASNVLTFNVG